MAQYRRKHPWFVPTLSKWVFPSVWRHISEDLLDECDQTDGGPPNDRAVEDYLRREGRYAHRAGERGKVRHKNALKELQAIKWKVKSSHVRAFEVYIEEWRKARRTMPARQVPTDKKLAATMLNAVRHITCNWCIYS